MTTLQIIAITLAATVGLILIFQVVESGIFFGGEQEAISEVVNENNKTSSISVTITGEVTRTGTYLMDPSSTLGDLINTASGVTSNADPLAYDTNYILQDGYSFYIAPKYDMDDVCSMSPINKVCINTATSEQLQSVSGIGATVANSIVSYRASNSQFGRIEDVKNVSGIGNATFEKIKNYITLRVQ